jgi:type IV secretory pathway VirB2 component (pilin)
MDWMSTEAFLIGLIVIGLALMAGGLAWQRLGKRRTHGRP